MVTWARAQDIQNWRVRNKGCPRSESRLSLRGCRHICTQKARSPAVSGALSSPELSLELPPCFPINLFVLLKPIFLQQISAWISAAQIDRNLCPAWNMNSQYTSKIQGRILLLDAGEQECELML